MNMDLLPIKVDVKADLSDSANEVIHNLTAPTTKSVGETLGDIWFLVFGGVSQVAAKRRLKYAYNLELLKQALDEELGKIPEGRRAEVDLQIVGPALEAAKYSVEHEDFRSMFARLIAASLNTDNRGKVHPAFVEFLKQMNPLDANVFKYVYENIKLPLITLIRNNIDNTGDLPLIRNLSCYDIAHYQEVSRALENLDRLGLINLEPGRTYTNKSNYELLTNDAVYISIRSAADSTLDHEAYTISEKLGMISRTDLGTAFYDICVKK